MHPHTSSSYAKVIFFYWALCVEDIPSDRAKVLERRSTSYAGYIKIDFHLVGCVLETEYLNRERNSDLRGSLKKVSCVNAPVTAELLIAFTIDMQHYHDSQMMPRYILYSNPWNELYDMKGNDLTRQAHEDCSKINNYGYIKI